MFIYTILMCEKIRLNNNGFPSLGDKTTVGFFTDEKETVEAVVNNACDINEKCYDYAIIEKYKEGLYGVDVDYKQRVFKFNHESGKYEEIEKPDVLKYFCGYSFS